MEMERGFNTSDKFYFKLRKMFLTKRLNRIGVLRCHYCGIAGLSVEQRYGQDIATVATIDHVEPISSGISKLLTSNWVVSCKDCNYDKGDMDYDEFVKSLPYVLFKRRKRQLQCKD
jgi:5-methylcytosine-specific restriction endonuclease McrA